MSCLRQTRRGLDTVPRDPTADDFDRDAWSTELSRARRDSAELLPEVPASYSIDIKYREPTAYDRPTDEDSYPDGWVIE